LPGYDQLVLSGQQAVPACPPFRVHTSLRLKLFFAIFCGFPSLVQRTISLFDANKLDTSFDRTTGLAEARFENFLGLLLWQHEQVGKAGIQIAKVNRCRLTGTETVTLLPKIEYQASLGLPRFYLFKCFVHLFEFAYFCDHLGFSRCLKLKCLS
jgi:hypothetical protein